MSQRILPPVIDSRKASDLFRSLREMVPHYTREWPAKDDDDPGVALLKIFSFIGEGVISRLNRAPDRNFLAFLDLLGIRLLQARPARVPVKFLVANGIEDSFIVDPRTQVSAPPTGERQEDLPFETLTPLLVIPSTLASLIAVDPEADAIYKPPSDFLERKLAATPLPELIVRAFSGVGAKNLQLDPPEQVKKGDFLRVDRKVTQRSGPDQCVPIVDETESIQSEHLVVVDDPKGAVVPLLDPLKADYVEGTSVQKVTQFELFQARNWQEHILYLAHADYFSIKSEAEITIRVQQAGTSSNLQSLTIVWEFFGSVAALKDEPDTWHEFQLEADGTQGFTRNGEIRLTKPEGEIKETEIDGKKSRWIRARLDQSLPANSPTPVPKIELIDFAVSSGGNKLAPDNAFNNDTPLTTDVPFFPFGTEPRIFDRFSIASEEAFSKHGAEVELDFSLDTTELLSSPSGFFDGTRLRVFSRAVAGKLLEFQITAQAVDIDRHGSPLDKPPVAGAPPPGVVTLKAASTPAVVTDNAGRIAIFVPGDDGKIYLRFLHPAAPIEREWKSLKQTPGTLQFDPAVVNAGGVWHVFAVADNKLYSLQLNPVNVGTAAENTDIAVEWFPINDSPQVNSSPFVLADGASPVVFLTDVDGVVRMLRNNAWTTFSQPNLAAKKNARPFARRNAAAFRVFVRSPDDQLLVFETSDPANPKTVAKLSARVGSNPHGSPDLPDPIYVRGAEDSHLWSTTDFLTWNDHGTSNNIELNGDPFVIENPAGTISVLSTSKKNVLLEFRIDQTALVTGKLEAGPRSIVFLAKVPTPAGTYYIHILDGPGKDSSNDAVRKIKDATHEFVVLDLPLLDASPTLDTEYDLLREEGSGTVTAVTAAGDTLTLSPVAGIQVNDRIFVENAVGTFQLRTIDAVLAGNDVHVSEDLDTSETLTRYVILRIDAQTHQNHATRLSELRAVLPAAAQAANNFYNNQFLRITNGPGRSPVGQRINDYFHDTNNVVLDSKFLEDPTNDSEFAISLSPVGEAWHVHEDKSQPDVRPELSWEYWNGKGFVHLPVEDTTNRFLVPGKVTFTIPDDIDKTEVAGQENYWIRARIVGGDYGREQFTFNKDTGEIKVEKDPIRPPKVNTLSISYHVTEHKDPQFCLTFNSLNYLDQTAANITDNKNFFPFIPLSDEGKTLYFGFDRAFKGGPVKIYFAAKELEVDERNKPKLSWQFAFNNDWKELLADDATEAFTRPDFVTLTVTDNIQNRQQFGNTLYWLRTTLTDGEWNGSPLFNGVFLNTVETMQARTVLDEILGSSTGEQDQIFHFQQTPVIEGEKPRVQGEEVRVQGEEVRVQEALTDEEREQLVLAEGKDTVLTITDQPGRVLATWIRWTEVTEFFDSDANSRHYRLDRHTGEIEFGDGVHGRIPPAGGDNIVAFRYQAGGGAAGNVKPGEINTAVTAVAGVDSVTNPVAAGGGSDAATNEDMLTIGPAEISHRDRAVTPDDFERLALEASREVRKARCLPNRNAAGRQEVGWTTVHIVPDSEDRLPVPSLGLRRAVQRYLSDRADATLVDQEHIVIGPPKYVPVTVEATVYAKSLDLVANAEQNVKKSLDTFLHPLKGGPDQQGWEFGRDLAASDLYALLEDIDEIDYVASLELFLGNSSSGEQVEVADDALIASGTHRITTTVAPENR